MIIITQKVIFRVQKIIHFFIYTNIKRTHQFFDTQEPH